MAWRDGMLTVNFPEELVRFLREIRQLDELGFDIPKSPIVTSTGASLLNCYFLLRVISDHPIL